ncbi:hypothetical protein C8R47DRAFT_1083236 [Mycena vitilis]|nr:hypothetical protein C8R47DRAFT_1083236 [Mycena vitilis]
MSTRWIFGLSWNDFVRYKCSSAVEYGIFGYIDSIPRIGSRVDSDSHFAEAVEYSRGIGLGADIRTGDARGCNRPLRIRNFVARRRLGGRLDLAGKIRWCGDRLGVRARRWSQLGDCGGIWNIPRIGSRVDSDSHFAEAVEYSRGIGLGADIRTGDARGCNRPLRIRNFVARRRLGGRLDLAGKIRWCGDRLGVRARRWSQLGDCGGIWNIPRIGSRVDSDSHFAEAVEYSRGIGLGADIRTGDARGCNRPLRIRNFVARRRLGGRLDLAGKIRWCGDRLGVRARRWSQLGDCGGIWNIPRIGSRVDSDSHFAEAVEYSRGIGLGADIRTGDARGCNRPLRIRNFVARRRLGGRLDLAGKIRWCGDRLGVRARRWSQLGDCGGIWNIPRIGSRVDSDSHFAEAVEYSRGIGLGADIRTGDARGCNRPLRIRNFVARRRLGGRLDLAGKIRWCGDRLGVRARRWSQLGDCGGIWNIPRIGSRVDSDSHFAEAVEYSRGIGLGADIRTGDARGCNRPLRIRNFVARRRLGGRLDLAGKIRWCGDRLGVRARRWSQLGDCGGIWNIPRIGSRVDSDSHFAEAVEYSRGIGLGADIRTGDARGCNRPLRIRNFVARRRLGGRLDLAGKIRWCGDRLGVRARRWSQLGDCGGIWNIPRIGSRVDSDSHFAEAVEYSRGIGLGADIRTGDARGCNRPLRIRNFVARRRLGGRLDLAGKIRWCGDRLGVRARRWSQLGDIPRIGSRVDSDLHFAEAVEYSRGIGLGADIRREMREGAIDRCESEISWHGGDWVDGWTWRAKSGGAVTDWACGLAAGVS